MAEKGRKKGRAGLRVLKAKRAGFCFGVKRAIDIAFREAEDNRGGIYTVGPIIHNPQVVGDLKKAGIRAADSVSELKRRKKVNAVIVRTHGIPDHDMKKLSGAGFNIIDATCPFVKKAQQYAKLLKEKGYRVVILGDKDHPEVRGIVSYAGEEVVVVGSADEYPPLRGRVGIVVQTTQQIENLKRLLSSAIVHAKELKVYNTICNSTALRLRETEEMARKADVMVIVGGKNSANTSQLANLCKSLGVSTYHIETADELDARWFRGARLVGLTAGASTPEWIIQDTETRIYDIGGKGADGP
jgi:4-hydroxy-3-methylbut-2-enyl diphosphate reductase